MLNDKINGLIAEALKASDKERLKVLKLIKARFIEELHKPGMKELSEDQEIKILRKMIDEREKSAGEYERAGRSDLVESEKAEISVIREFIPKPLTDEETETLVESVISGKEGLGMKDMKPLMAEILSKNPAAESSKVARILKSKLMPG